VSATRFFDPQPVADEHQSFWGLEAAHYLRPKTSFAEHLAKAIEEAWDTSALADAITKEPRPDDFTVINRRAEALSNHYWWLEENFPETIPEEDQDTVFLGLLLVREAHRDCGGALLAALSALDHEIRRQLADLDDGKRDELLSVRDGWRGRLEELQEGDADVWAERDGARRMLMRRMSETIDLLTEQLA